MTNLSTKSWPKLARIGSGKKHREPRKPAEGIPSPPGQKEEKSQAIRRGANSIVSHIVLLLGAQSPDANVYQLRYARR